MDKFRYAAGTYLSQDEMEMIGHQAISHNLDDRVCWIRFRRWHAVIYKMSGRKHAIEFLNSINETPIVADQAEYLSLVSSAIIYVIIFAIRKNCFAHRLAS